MKVTREPEVQACATWPNDVDYDLTTHRELAVNAAKKQRLQLSPQGESELLSGHPLEVNGKVWGAVVFCTNKGNHKLIQRLIKQIQWSSVWLEYALSTLSTPPPPQPTQPTPSMQAAAATPEPIKLRNLLGAVLKENTAEECTIATVNFIAAYLNVDNVSISLLHGKSLSLSAVSFLSTIDSRTKPIQLVTEAMYESLTQKRSIEVFANTPLAGEPDKAAITLAHEKLVQDKNLKSVHSFILRTNKEIVGIMTLENHSRPNLDQATRTFVEQSLAILASVFHIKSQSHKSTLKFIRERFFDFLQRLFGPKNPIKKACTTLVLLFIACLFIPVPFSVSADAVLESTNKYLITSPYDGYLHTISAEAGDLVEKGHVLATLKDQELILEKRKISSEIQQYNIEYDNALAQGSRAQAAILAAQLEQSKIKLALTEKKLERTRLISPIDGLVISEALDPSIGMPIKQGDVLFHIAEANKYRVVMQIPEKDIRFLRPGRTGTATLTSLPGKYLDLNIFRVTPTSEINQGKNFFRVDANITSELTEGRHGMTGSAKIEIEKRNLGWVLFHDVLYWFRRVFWL